MNRNGIIKTIKGWRSSMTKNPYVNRALALILGFLPWNIWKEKNNHIFNNQSSEGEMIWAKALQSVCETVLLHPWSLSNWEAKGLDATTFCNPQLFLSPSINPLRLISHLLVVRPPGALLHLDSINLILTRHLKEIQALLVLEELLWQLWATSGSIRR